MRMGGVAGEEHAAVAEAVGDGALAHPHALVLDRIGDVAADAAAHQRRDVQALQAGLVDIDELQPPQLLAVDDREKRPGPFRADEHVAERLLLVAGGEQIRDAQIDGHRPVEMRLAANGDAEQLAHGAGKAVAADQIAGAHGLGRAGALIAQASRSRRPRPARSSRAPPGGAA